MKSEPKPKARSKNHEIINRFLKLENAKVDKYFWPREMKFVVKLLKKYPYEFLVQLKEPFYPLKMNSLAWFQAADGESFLAKHYFDYVQKTTNLTQEKEEIVLSNDKIGEDIQVTKKPKTLKDFLNYYGKNEGISK